MKPIRVLHVVTKMDAAGLETFIMNIYRNINRKEIQFDFLTHRTEVGFYDEEIKSFGGRIFSIPSINPMKHAEYIKNLNKFMEENKEYEIIHSHINAYSMYILRAAKKYNIPVRISHSHALNNKIDLKSPFRAYNKYNLGNYATDKFACSVSAGNWLFGEKNQFKVVNNAIDTKNYIYNESTRKKIRKQFNLTNKFVVGHIGRFTKIKNHLLITKIFKEILKKNNEAVLLLVGDGALRADIEKEVKKMGISNNVIFTGVRSDVSDLLQAMDTFLFPSIVEGLGIVAVEAQAAGLPTFVSTSIPNEAFVTDLIHAISLEEKPRYWADKIFKYTESFKRVDHSTEIIDNGYDVAELSEYFEKFYTEKVNRK